MNQVEEESLYHSLEEEAIDVDCLLVEPRSDQVSVSSVWCFEEDNIGKCIKTEDASYNLGVPDSNINVEGVDTTKLNALDVLPHEVGVENLLTSNGISPCDDYLIDIGYVDHGACIDYVSNEPLHVGNSSSESPFPMFRNKGNFGIQNSLTDSIPESECQNYFLGNIFGTDSKTVDKFEDFSKSFIDEEDDEGNLPLQFAQTGMELTPFRQDLITNSAQEHGVGGITHKRSRKPTKRYIDESSNLTLKNCKKRKEPSSMSKVKMSTVRRVKSQNEVKPKENIQSSEISFGKAIQVPFISQCPTECQKISLPTTTENQIESFSSGSGDDSETQMMRSMTGGNQRKLHRLWTVSEVKKLIDGVAHFGVGKWTHIKKLLFSTSVHRTPVDLKDKWRNLLKASRALKGSRIEDEQKRSQPWRPLPKSILCRVRELASTYPYPRVVSLQETMASTLLTKAFVGASSSCEPSRLASLRHSDLGSANLRISTHRRSPPKKLEIHAAGSTYGNYFRVTTYGESHGGGVGCIIDGCPPRFPISEADLQADLDRRRPGQSRITTPRKETDTCTIFSGVADGYTTGSPIMINVPNTDQRGKDYSEMSKAYRPSHADATYDFKYGVRSVEGGGRSSARETIGRVASGAVAKKILKAYSGTEILAYVSQAHTVVLPEDLVDHNTLTLEQVESNIVRCPDPEYAEKMIAAIDAVRVRGDSVGGVVTCIVRNAPRGLGSPVFDKLEAELAKAAMSLPATKGFEIGSGFAGTLLTGSEHNDAFYTDENGRIRTRTNRSGGIQGGISNGEIIYMRIAFKPTSTIGRKQNTVTRDKNETELIARGRHDPCVVPRAVPMVEAMVALVLVDQLMAQYAQCELFPINPDFQEPLKGPELYSAALF